MTVFDDLTLNIPLIWAILSFKFSCSVELSLKRSFVTSGPELDFA